MHIKQLHNLTKALFWMDMNVLKLLRCILPLSSCIVLTSWQAGTQFLASRMLSHSREFAFHAKLSSTCSSTWLRCLTTSRNRPSSARTSTSITFNNSWKKGFNKHTQKDFMAVFYFYFHSLFCVHLPCKSDKREGQRSVRLVGTLPAVDTRRWRSPDSRRSTSGETRPAVECPETYGVMFSRH